MKSRAPIVVAGALIAGLLIARPARAQVQPGSGSAPAASPAAPAGDSLRRDTPRGTVRGFLDAARKSADTAALYLDTNLRDAAASELARKLFVVLDRRLPARLNELSDRPEGSRINPLKPDEEIIGTIQTESGPLDLIVERVSRGALGQVWLFSRQTLKAIPDVYDEVDRVSVERYLPPFLQRQLAGIRLFEWLALLLLVPASYRLTGALDPALRPALAAWRRRRGTPGTVRKAAVVPGFLRLVAIALAIRWVLTTVALPLLERQFWTDISAMLFVVAVAWGFLVLNGVIERSALRKFHSWGHREVVAILRLLRRGGDALVLMIAVLVTLNYFGFDPTAALAGLGIGGIAVALAAQKTLENVIGGLSIVLDQAVRVGDAVKLGDAVGTVEGIGLRSTRIRTMGRTILNVPNGQIANANIETLSDRDKFWLRHVLAIGLDTPPALMRTTLEQLRRYLAAHPLVDSGESIRVRFLSVSTFSLDVEVFAYIRARDWDEFLQVQEELLLGMLECVELAGARIALPAQLLHLSSANDPSAAARHDLPAPAARRAVPGERAGSA